MDTNEGYEGAVLLTRIQTGIDMVECKTGERPNKIVLGIENQVLLRAVGKNDLVVSSQDPLVSIYGIPVETDYKNPATLKVCYEVDV